MYKEERRFSALCLTPRSRQTVLLLNGLQALFDLHNMIMQMFRDKLANKPLQGALTIAHVMSSQVQITILQAAQNFIKTRKAAG